MRLLKDIIMLGVTSSLLLCNYTTVFASESGAYLYENEIAAVSGEAQSYFAIVVGDSDGVIDRNELTLDIGNDTFRLRDSLSMVDESEAKSSEDYGSPIPELRKRNGRWLNPKELMNDVHSYDAGVALEFLISKSSANSGLCTNVLGVVKLPDGVDVSELDTELQKYVIYAKNIPEKLQGWKLDHLGWRYANGDGTYLINQWKEVDGKFYYLGDDGYMLRSTRTPDGYYVDLNGEWVGVGDSRDKTI